MKTTKLTSLLTFITSSLILCLATKTTTAQTETAKIPWAKEQPAWVFPIYFEEGSGQKDTFYLGYDKDANPGNVNRNFGEFCYKDTSAKFEVLYNNLCYPEVRIQRYVATRFDLIFKNGHFPLTIRWDPKYLYTDSLPGYKSEGKEPPVVIFLDCDATCPELSNGKYCPIDAQNIHLLSDTSQGHWYFPVKGDSLYFDIDSTVCPLNDWGISLKVFPWEWLTVGVKEVQEISYFTIYPNPANNFLIIKPMENFLGETEVQLRIYSALGQMTKEEFISTKEQSQINLDYLQNGIYILELVSNNKHILIRKIFQKLQNP